MALSIGSGGAWKSVPSIYVGASGVWKLVQNIYVGVSGVWKLIQTAAVGVMSPGNQATSAVSASHTFTVETFSSTEGTPTGFAWSLSGQVNGSWSLSGGSLSTQTITVTGVTVGTSSATVTCTATVFGGFPVSASATLQYVRT